MEKSNSVSFSPESIKNILTLRYNSEIHPILPKLTWNDFTSTNNKSSTEFIEQLMKNTLQNSIEEDCKKISKKLC